MKKLFIFLLFIVFSFIFSVTTHAIEINPISPQLQNTTDLINNSIVGEQIKNYQIDIDVKKDGSMDVKEDILYYFDSPRHGIYRNIPYTLYDNSTRYDMDFKFADVVDENGKKYKVSRSRNNEQWILKIGDPNRTISGEHRYIINYKVNGALRFFKDHDELYWNATGNYWNFPIKKAKVTIRLPKEVPETSIKIQCFTGSYGSDKSNCIGSSNGPTATFENTVFLNQNEGLTVAYSFPKGTTEVLFPVKYIPFFDRWYGKIVLIGLICAGIFWYVILPIYLIFRWFQKGRDPFVGIAPTATYDPPKIGKVSLTPAESGALLDEHVDKRDLFAAIVDLARRGYLKIEEPTKKEFYLRRTHSAKKSDKLQDFEYKLLNGLFIDGDYISVKKTEFYTLATEIEDMLYKRLVTLGLFPKNPKTTRNVYYGIASLGLVTFNWVLSLVAFIFGRIIPRKTQLGATYAQQAQGLKNFLTSQERQLNFQGDRQMLFEKLLPFAVAFGVEKAWAKRFENFDLKNPDWYQSSSSTHFNSMLFASSLSQSYSNFAVSATPPSSSSSSGFGGGGFSGGGGGGGGGGSW